MGTVKTIKVFPAPHVEIRLHVSKEMEEDFKRCDGYVLMPPACEDCSWNNVKIAGTFCCGTFMKEIKRQLGLE